MTEYAYKMSAKADFPSWLMEQMAQRRWSQAELARRAGLSRTAISDYINGKRTNYESDAMKSIARAMDLPQAIVFRAAGIYTEQQESDPLIEEGIHILRQLEGENKEDAIRYLRLRRQVQEERGVQNARGKKRPATSG